MAETTELKKSDFYFDLPQELIAAGSTGGSFFLQASGAR